MTGLLDGKLALITVALGYYASSFTPNIWSILQETVEPQAVGPASGIINGLGAGGGGAAATPRTAPTARRGAA